MNPIKAFLSFMVLMSLLSPTSWASIKSKKGTKSTVRSEKPTREVFQAVEGDGYAIADVKAPQPEWVTPSEERSTELDAAEPTSPSSSSPALVESRSQTSSLEAKIEALQHEVAELKKAQPQTPKDNDRKSAATPKAFEQVPEKYRDSISKRLSIVQKLILEHGRAYDYRSMTTQDLETILASLEQKTIN